jgi:hypothetical protein
MTIIAVALRVVGSDFIMDIVHCLGCMQTGHDRSLPNSFGIIINYRLFENNLNPWRMRVLESIFEDRDSSVGILDCPGIESRVGGSEIFRTRPDRPSGPPSLLYVRYRVPFPGVKWRGRGINPPTPSSAGVKEIVELYLYFSSRLSWPVLGRNFTF